MLLLLPLLLLLLPPTFADDYRRTTLPNRTSTSSSTGTPHLSTWTFSGGSKDGWGLWNSGQQDAEVESVAGHLRIAITGPSPYVDSPRMHLNAWDRMALVVRYRFLGPSNVGKLVLRGNSDAAILSDPSYMRPGRSWTSGADGDVLTDVYFPVVGDGEWRTTYARFADQINATQPLERAFNGTLTQIR